MQQITNKISIQISLKTIFIVFTIKVINLKQTCTHLFVVVFIICMMLCSISSQWYTLWFNRHWGRMNTPFPQIVHKIRLNSLKVVCYLQDGLVYYWGISHLNIFCFFLQYANKFKFLYMCYWTVFEWSWLVAFIYIYW